MDFGVVITEMDILVAVGVVMLLDILSGFAAAAKAQEVKSSKMRDGFWHKAGWLGCIVLVMTLQVFAPVFARYTGDVPGVGGALAAVCGVGVGAISIYIVLTEIVSIVENLCKLNPAIADSPVGKWFANSDKAEPLEVDILNGPDGQDGSATPA